MLHTKFMGYGKNKTPMKMYEFNCFHHLIGKNGKKPFKDLVFTFFYYLISSILMTRCSRNIFPLASRMRHSPGFLPWSPPCLPLSSTTLQGGGLSRALTCYTLMVSITTVSDMWLALTILSQRAVLQLNMQMLISVSTVVTTRAQVFIISCLK